MRQLLLAAGALCAVGVLTHATAQNQQMSTMQGGQVVSTTFGSATFQQVGSRLPDAAPRVGQPINLPEDTPLMRRYDPRRPMDMLKGTNIDPKSIIAPVQAYDYGQQGDAYLSATDRFFNKVKAAFGIQPKPSLPPPPNVTPGIFRRNRERAKMRMWRID